MQLHRRRSQKSGSHSDLVSDERRFRDVVDADRDEAVDRKSPRDDRLLRRDERQQDGQTPATSEWKLLSSGEKKKISSLAHRIIGFPIPINLK